MTTPCVLVKVNHSAGYRRDRRGGQQGYAHRIEWEAVNGTIPPGLVIDHLCRTRNCVNVAHMEVVSRSENMRRQVAWQSLKTHCPAGHPYAGHNLILAKRPSGREARVCRICTNRANLAYLRRKAHSAPSSL